MCQAHPRLGGLRRDVQYLADFNVGETLVIVQDGRLAQLGREALQTFETGRPRWVSASTSSGWASAVPNLLSGSWLMRRSVASGGGACWLR